MSGTYWNGRRFVKAEEFHRPVRAAPAVKKQPKHRPIIKKKGTSK